MSSATVFDSTLFGNIFGTEEIRKYFSERAYVSKLIEAECALAQAEEDEGVIPTGTASVIRENSHVSKIDWKLLAERTEIVGYPILGLVEQMASWVPHRECKQSSCVFLDLMVKLTPSGKLDTSIGGQRPKISWTWPLNCKSRTALVLLNVSSERPYKYLSP